MHSRSRRQFLATVGLAGAALATRATPGIEPAATARRRVLRIAHLTDIHVQPELAAPAGMAKALRHAQNQPDRPDLLFLGGDLIMDSLKADKARTQLQWDLWRKVFSAERKIEAHVAIGNHDVWGWAVTDQPSIETDPLYGKGFPLEMLGLKDRYYSFERNGWHFIVLDSTHRAPGAKSGYTARLDDVQFAWLARDLERTPASMPVCVLSHIPLLCFCALFDGENEATGSWIVPGAWAHIDGRRIKDLFRRHPNVKVCLSGHIHLADAVEYLGVRYFCNGAVSGGWWKGPYQEFDSGYALVDLYDDGTVENRMIYDLG